MIALDVDGVLCNWWGGIIRTARKMGVEGLPDHENWVHEWFGHGEAFYTVWDAVKGDREWWMGLDPIKGAREAINFDVDSLLTARPIPPEWTRDWALMHGFRFNWVWTTPKGVSKLSMMKQKGFRILVDDKPETFDEVNKASGVMCFLMDQPWNRAHEAAALRIKSLSDVQERMKGSLGAAPPPLQEGK